MGLGRGGLVLGADKAQRLSGDEARAAERRQRCRGGVQLGYRSSAVVGAKPNLPHSRMSESLTDTVAGY